MSLLHLAQTRHRGTRRLFMLVAFVCAIITMTAREDDDAKMILNNVEPIQQFSIDSTGSWWAVTKPFSEFVNLYVNGQRFGPYSSVITPRFSTDGSTWLFAFVRNLQYYVRTPSGEQRVSAERIDAITYPSQSTVPWIEYTVGDVRTATDGVQQFSTSRAVGAGRLDPTGTVIWHVAQRGSQVALVRNGVDKYLFDEVVLAGVWADARPVYASRSGNQWTVYVGDQEVLTGLQTVQNITVNVYGTVLAFSAARSGAPMNAYIYTDDYKDVWTGPNLEYVSNLVLSPCCDLIAVTGKLQAGARMVLFNSASYPAGTESSLPVFSYDGAHMAFAGNDGEGFVSMDGRRFTVKGGGVSLKAPIAVSPSGRSVAWVSGSTLVVYDVDAARMSLGKMCDTMGTEVIFNRRTSQYQALGTYGGRLFLLTSPAP